MKHIFAFLLLFIVPTVSMADWVGRVDKRRYVSESEKSQYPYNLIVKVRTPEGGSTGTIIAPNVILTCGHCVSDVGLNGSVQYYTTDGQSHTGTVWHYKYGASLSQDYALIVGKDAQDGPFLNVASSSVAETNAMRAGYDTLKVLSNNEIKVVRDAFVQALSKYKKITDANVDNAMREVSNILKSKDCSKTSDKNNCVNCTGQRTCIFEDSDKLKVQDSCNASRLQGVDSGGMMIMTTCATNQAGSGSPLIDSQRKNLIGVIVGTYGFGIGQTMDATSYAIQPEVYHKATQSLINMADAGFIEY